MWLSVSGRTVYLYRANDRRYRRALFIRDGEPVTFDWKGYDHFATHKDVAKSRLKMSNPWHLLAVDSEVD